MKTVSYELASELLEVLKITEEFLCGPTAWTQEQEDDLVEKVSCTIAKAEAAMAEPQPDADGWIKWEGGECPIDTPAHDLFIRFRNGKEESDYVSRAQSYYWQRERKAHPADIIAYRIVEGD